METKVKNIQQLILKSDLDNHETYSFNVSDIVAIIPKEQEIVVMTKGGKSKAIKSYIPEEDTVKIFYETFMFLDDDLPFEKREYGFVMLSDHSIINLDEITNVNIGGEDNKVLNISFDNTTIKINKNVEDMYEYLKEIRELISNARADEAAELQ